MPALQQRLIPQPSCQQRPQNSALCSWHCSPTIPLPSPGRQGRCATAPLPNLPWVPEPIVATEHWGATLDRPGSGAPDLCAAARPENHVEKVQTMVYKCSFLLLWVAKTAENWALGFFGSY